MLKRIKNQKGFTLIELIVVIAILGILAAILIPRFAGVQDTAKKSADESSVQQIANQLELAYVSGTITSADFTSGTAFELNTTAGGVGDKLVAAEYIKAADIPTGTSMQYYTGPIDVNITLSATGKSIQSIVITDSSGTPQTIYSK